MLKPALHETLQKRRKKKEREKREKEDEKEEKRKRGNEIKNEEGLIS